MQMPEDPQPLPVKIEKDIETNIGIQFEHVTRKMMITHLKNMSIDLSHGKKSVDSVRSAIKNGVGDQVDSYLFDAVVRPRLVTLKNNLDSMSQIISQITGGQI